MSTYYETLQVSETASSDIIKQRFQQLILKVTYFVESNQKKQKKTEFLLAPS
ncbi:hypothetical protein BD408DRAFT_418998 [Parasitella parasitica]|nr:hypothetical protein BD408DRAFT_418998 [Parasitella parasitica]